MSNANPARAGMAPPLPRAWLDTIAPALRVLFGLIFIAWSWISTLLVLGALLVPVLPGTSLAGIPDRAVVAISAAFLISLIEFVSSDRWPVVYWSVLLLCDASFTSWQTRVWLVLIVSAQTHIELAGHIVIWFVSIICGIVAAKFGEVLLFGKGHEG